MFTWSGLYKSVTYESVVEDLMASLKVKSAEPQECSDTKEVSDEETAQPHE